jgi:hypothetical protein
LSEHHGGSGEQERTDREGAPRENEHGNSESERTEEKLRPGPESATSRAAAGEEIVIRKSGIPRRAGRLPLLTGRAGLARHAFATDCYSPGRSLVTSLTNDLPLYQNL